MTDLWHNAYLKEATARVVSTDPLRLDDCLFYPAGGGQPGDSGRLVWEGGETGIADTRKGPDGPVLIPEGPIPPEGAEVRQVLDWDRRFGHMRVHTALHLLSVVVKYPVTGGQIGATKGRLDFAMEHLTLEKEAVEAELNALVAEGYAVSEEWITEEELDENPSLVKTLRVKPPRGQGDIRLVRIGPVDLQPCGGTHVRSTTEVGRLTVTKIESKGRENRRVTVALA